MLIGNIYFYFNRYTFFNKRNKAGGRIVPKVSQYRFLSRLDQKLMGTSNEFWLIKLSVQTFQPLIEIYRRGNIVYLQ